MKNKKNNPKEKQEFKRCPKCGAVGNWFIGDLCVKCDREKNKNETSKKIKS